MEIVAAEPAGDVDGLADGVEAGDVGASSLIHDYAAAGVVRCGYHRNRLAADVDAVFQAALVDGGEVAFDELGRLVADIEVDAVDA